TQDDGTAFIDNAFDYPLAHSFVLFKQVENNVAEVWEFQQLSNESSNLFSGSCAVSNDAQSSSYTASKNSMRKKKVYAETIGIAHKAINIAIEKNDPQVLKFLKGYILQNEHSLVENTTIVCSSSSRTSILEERSEPNTILGKPQVKVSNPIKKNQTSKVQGKRPKLTRGLGTNTCGECGDKGHNHRWHAKCENKVCGSTITCELCGGCGYNKKLHENDSIGINELDYSINDENEWADSNSSKSEEIEMDI
ncbi:17360_t:CDS:2, partial [Racocetra fulgida]